MIKIVPVLCGRISIERGIFTGRENDGCLDLPVVAYLIRHPKGVVLFDTGLPPAVSASGQPMQLGPGVTAYPASSGGILRQLRLTGLKAEDIVIIINSHLHPDHAGGNTLFPQACFYIQEGEIKTALADGTYDESLFGPSSRFSRVSGCLDLFGDRTCCLVETPGHSPGHQSMIVTSDHHKVLLVGDACLRPGNLKGHEIPLIVHDQDKAFRSLSRLRDIALAEQAIVLTSHDPHLQFSRRQSRQTP